MGGDGGGGGGTVGGDRALARSTSPQSVLVSTQTRAEPPSLTLIWCSVVMGTRRGFLSQKIELN